MRNVFIIVALAALAAGGYLYYEMSAEEELAEAVEAANATVATGDLRVQFELPDMQGVTRQSSVVLVRCSRAF